jgi:hypothetical protein
MKLILGHMDTARLEQEIASRNQDQGAYMDRAAMSIEDNMQQMMPQQQMQPQQMPQEQMQQPQEQGQFMQ